jgi:hypothetical protein
MVLNIFYKYIKIDNFFYYLLFIIYYLLFIIYYLLFIIYYLLFIIYYFTLTYEQGKMLIVRFHFHFHIYY